MAINQKVKDGGVIMLIVAFVVVSVELLKTPVAKAFASFKLKATSAPAASSDTPTGA